MVQLQIQFMDHQRYDPDFSREVLTSLIFSLGDMMVF